MPAVHRHTQHHHLALSYLSAGITSGSRAAGHKGNPSGPPRTSLSDVTLITVQMKTGQFLPPSSPASDES